MTATDEATAAAGPELLARGRFALTAMPDGSLVLRHAAPLCATCEACGCGDQRDPIVVPPMLASIIKAHGEGRRIGIGQIRQLMAMAMGMGPGPGELEQDGATGG